MPRAALLFVTVVLTAQSAAADAIPGPRSDCPRGTHATMPTRHGEGSMCELAPTCTRTASCAAHQRCIATSICIDGDYVVGACGPHAACERGTCTHTRRCAGNTPWGALPGPLHAQARGALGVVGLAALGATGALRRRRRGAAPHPRGSASS